MPFLEEFVDLHCLLYLSETNEKVAKTRDFWRVGRNPNLVLFRLLGCRSFFSRNM